MTKIFKMNYLSNFHTYPFNYIQWKSPFERITGVHKIIASAYTTPYGDILLGMAYLTRRAYQTLVTNQDQNLSSQPIFVAKTFLRVLK